MRRALIEHFPLFAMLLIVVLLASGCTTGQLDAADRVGDAVIRTGHAATQPIIFVDPNTGASVGVGVGPWGELLGAALLAAGVLIKATVDRLRPRPTAATGAEKGEGGSVK